MFLAYCNSWLRNIFSCLYNILLWNKFFEPCGIDHCTSTRTPEFWRLPGHRITFSKHEIHHICITCETLVQLNLYHMDSLDGPAAIHGSSPTSSKSTQSVSPNELIHPEISMSPTNHANNVQTKQTTNIWCTDKQCWTWDYPVCLSRPTKQPNNTSAN